MGPIIPKEMKFNLHYGKVRGDVLPPPHGTNTSCWHQKVQVFDIWYTASSSSPLPKLFKLWHWGKKWPRAGGHLLYIDPYREKNFKIVLVWKEKAQAFDF